MNNCEMPETTKDTKYKSYAVMWLSALLVAGITFYIYIPALQYDFVNWDDQLYAYKNNHIKSLDYNSLKWALTSTSEMGFWYPVTLFSFAVDYSLWGLNPKGYHLTNIIFHTANTILVFILVIRLTCYIEDRKALAAAIIASLLFGIHPLHVESVAWVSERKDVLYSFFYLLSILAYIRYVSLVDDAGNNKIYGIKWRNMKFYFLTGILFFLSIASKPMSITLPFVLLLLDIYPFRRLPFPFYKKIENQSVKSILIEKIPFFILSFLLSLEVMWAGSKGNLFGQTVQYYHPVVNRLCIAVRAYVFYLSKMIVPVNLAPVYPYPKDISLFSLEYLGAFFLLILITYICLRAVSTIFSIVWFYYLITLLPVIGVMQIGGHAAADRYTYLPALGFFILAGLGVQYLFNRYSEKRYAIIFLIGGITAIFFIMADMTVKQISIWKDSLTLWSYEIKLFPDTAYEAYNGRGSYYSGISNYEQAVADFSRAVEINPRHALVYNNRGKAYNDLHFYNKAVDDLNRAIELKSDMSSAFNNRGISYYFLGNYTKSISDYKKAIELDPLYSQAYFNLSLAYSKIGDNEQAIYYSNKSVTTGKGLKNKK